jgi:hypothetical protein
LAVVEKTEPRCQKHKGGSSAVFSEIKFRRNAWLIVVLEKSGESLLE